MVKVFVVSENYDLTPVERLDLSNENDQTRIDDYIRRLKDTRKKITIQAQQNDDQDMESFSSFELDQLEVESRLDERADTEAVQETIGETSEPKIPVPQQQNFVGNQPESDLNLNVDLESEKIANEENARKRMELLTSIIVKNPVNFSMPEFLFYTIGISSFGFLLTLPLTFFPLHDIIQYPEYWYEVLICVMFNASVGSVGSSFTCSYFLNIKYIRDWKNICFVGALGNVVTVFWVTFTYLLWTICLGYTYPIPFLGFMTAYLMINTYIIAIWIRLPKDWRQNTRLQRQMISYFLYIQINFLSPIIINIIVKLIRKFQNGWQPMIGLLLPLTRDAFIMIENKIFTDCSNGDPGQTNIFFKYNRFLQFTVNTAFVIGSYATKTTSWTLMGYGFYKDIKLCIQIVRINIANQGTIEDQAIKLQNLALNEIAEFHAPLSILLVVLVAYYSPNGHLYGNIRNNYWQYEEIENIGQTIFGMGIFFLVDFSTGVICAFILWFSCKINFWKAFLALEKEFTIGFCVKLGRATSMVSA